MNLIGKASDGILRCVTGKFCRNYHWISKCRPIGEEYSREKSNEEEREKNTSMTKIYPQLIDRLRVLDGSNTLTGIVFLSIGEEGVGGYWRDYVIQDI